MKKIISIRLNDEDLRMIDEISTYFTSMYEKNYSREFETYKKQLIPEVTTTLVIETAIESLHKTLFNKKTD